MERSHSRFQYITAKRVHSVFKANKCVSVVLRHDRILPYLVWFYLTTGKCTERQLGGNLPPERPGCDYAPHNNQADTPGQVVRLVGRSSALTTDDTLNHFQALIQCFCFWFHLYHTRRKFLNRLAAVGAAKC